MCEEVA